MTASETETTNDWKELAAPGGPSNLLFQITVINPAEDARQIPSDASVLINLTARQADHSQHHTGPIFQQAKSWLVSLNDCNVLIRPLEWLIRQMKEKEKALLFIPAKNKHHPFQQSIRNYNNNKNDSVIVSAESSNLLYEMEVLQIVMDTSRLNPYFPIQKALTMKAIANDLYQYEWDLVDKQQPQPPDSNKMMNSREKAIHLYEKAAKIVQTLLDGTYFANVEPDHPQRKQCETILGDCHNNTMAVYLRAKRWAKAREVARHSLSSSIPTLARNPKTHLRNVKAHILDPTTSKSESLMQETELAIQKAESVICYKHEEDQEFQVLKAKWKKKQQEQQRQQQSPAQ